MVKTKFNIKNFIIYLLVNILFKKKNVNSNVVNSVKLSTIKLPFLCESNREFQCLNTEKCINSKQICDGTFDCPDRSDEYNCYCKIFKN